ncbi:MAG: hypothetical protein AAGI15_13505 [Pseudomonadota bacterium]
MLEGRSHRFFAARLLWLGLIVSPMVLAQEYRAPRLPGTQLPDLNGVWQALGAAHYDLEPHAASASLQVRRGPHGPVPSIETLHLGSVGAVPASLGVVVGGRIPYLPAARERAQENRRHWSARDPEVKCYLPGVPRATYMPYPLQIVQSADALMIAYEYAGAVRDIDLEDPGEAPIDSWMGWSAGRYEGDTLVVEVTGQNGRTWLDRAGNQASASLIVTERYTPMSPWHLMYEATLTDPESFARPWTIRMPLYRRVGSDAQLLEFKCAEFVEELMFGRWRRAPLPRTLEAPAPQPEVAP